MKKIVKAIREKNLFLDSLFLIGCFLVVYTNYMVDVLLGNYFLGVTLILASIICMKNKGR